MYYNIYNLQQSLVMFLIVNSCLKSKSKNDALAAFKSGVAQSLLN